MGVAQDVARLVAGVHNGFVVSNHLASELAVIFQRRLYKLELLTAVPDRPVAASLADHLELLQKGTLVPVLANLSNLAGRVEGYYVNL